MGLPWVELGLVLLALVLGPIGYGLGMSAGRQIGREGALRDLAELAGKQREAMQRKVDKTPKPASAEDALDEV